MHTHEIGDNKYISHSHPYNKSNDSEPYKSHHHTKEQILFLQNLEILFPLFSLVVVLTPFFLKGHFYLEIKSDYKFVFFQSKNRARSRARMASSIRLSLLNTICPIASANAP